MIRLVGEHFELLQEEKSTPFVRAWIARDKRTDTEATLWLVRQVLSPGEVRGRLVAAARALSAANLPHHVRVLDAGLDPFIEDPGVTPGVGAERGAVYVALAPTPGQTLAARSAAGRPASDTVVAYLAASLAEAIDEAHARGIVHGYLRARDVIMAGEQPRVQGMGLWTALERPAALIGMRAELHALAPEVRAGEMPSARSDVHALAIILAEVALGMVAENAAEAAAVRDRLRRERPRLEAALAPAFQAAPEKRPASATLLAAELVDLLPRGRKKATSKTATVKAEEPMAAAGLAMDMAAEEVEEEDDLPFDQFADPATIPVDPPSTRRPIVSHTGLTPPPKVVPAPPPAFARSSGANEAIITAPPLPRDEDGLPTGQHARVEPATTTGRQAAALGATPVATPVDPDFPIKLPAERERTPLPLPAPEITSVKITAIQPRQPTSSPAAATAPRRGHVPRDEHTPVTGPMAKTAPGIPAVSAAALPALVLTAVPPWTTPTAVPALPGAMPLPPRLETSSPTAPARAWVDAQRRGVPRPLIATAAGIGLGLAVVAVIFALTHHAHAPAAVHSASPASAVAPPPEAPPPPAKPAPAPAPAPRAASVAPATPDIAPLATCPPGMTPVPGLRACIDVYEAPGRGQLPATNVTLAVASAACEARHARLCAPAEWEAACRGPRKASYPWGQSATKTRCNLGPGAALRAVGTQAECLSASGALDMAGNAAEWLAGGEIRGASAEDGGDGRCSSKVRAPDGFARGDVGYRCCLDAP